jgi:hypothetical protein
MPCSRMRKVHSKDGWESFGCGQLWPGVDYQVGYFDILEKELSKQLKIRGTTTNLRCSERGTWETLEWAILMGRKAIANGLLRQCKVRPHIYIWT